MTKRYLELREALLSRERWRRAGAHSRDLASRDFTPVFPGIHTLTDHPATFDAMGWALQNKVMPGSVLSHSTAAVLWGIPIPVQLDDGVVRVGEGLDGVILPRPFPAVRDGQSLRSGAKLPVLHCRVPQGGSSGPVRGAVVHRWVPGPSLPSQRLVLSSPVETLRELATVLPVWDVTVAIDAVIGRRTSCPPVAVGDIVEHVAAMRGRRGTARLRAALGFARTGSWSPSETIMRLLLVGAGFPEPSLNHLVRAGEEGEVRYLDLAWAEAGFALEYDGDGHRRTKEQWRRDETRRDELASRGWTLARSNGADLRHPLRILRRVARGLAEKGVAAVPSDQQIRAFVASLAVSRPTHRVAADQPHA